MMKIIRSSRATIRPNRATALQAAGRSVLSLCLLWICCTASLAQCDKDLRLTSSKTEFLNGLGEVQRAIEEKSVIEITKTQVTITPGSQATMKGTIQSHACNWKVPYKEGKSVIQATFTSDQGDTMNATMTIEGKDDRVTVFVDLKEMPDRKIRVTLDTFEEKAMKSP
jgi:hypothetical protein